MLLTVNGVVHDLAVGEERTVLSVLRHELHLTAAKPGCGEGVCGACTILVHGSPTRSCVLTVGELAGRPVETLEGLAANGRLHPVQQAFLATGAFQCGYCTPGMIMSTVALLAADAHADEAAIVDALDGNVCRCCTYARIIRAVRRAAQPTDEPLAVPGPSPEPTLDRPDVPWDLVGATERDWFAVLSDGLVAVAEPPPSPERWSTSAGAWLHVAGDGAVTAFTGKVDVGQGNRTALSWLVADELGVPIESVRLVMGDTDLCPHDEGTVGSRSMADAGPLLRRAAAAARSSLAERPPAPGERRVELASDQSAPARAVNKTPVRRQEALDVVSGAMRYPGDLTRDGMLHGWVLKPPTPDAHLRECDLEAARAIDGVTVVRDGGFIGVTAADPEKLAEAKGLVRAEWSSPAGPDEAELAAYLRSHPVELEGWARSFDHELGDVQEALGAAAIRLDATYSTAYVAHVPLETRAALAEWDGERLTVWTGTQRPFGVRAELAGQLDLPEARVRVIAPTAGSGFGGKHSGEAAIEAARLSRATGRPVKVHWSRAEEFGAAYVRPAAVIDIRSGADSDGTLSAWEFLNVGSGAAGIGCPYVIPNQTIRFQPADSPLRHGSYRALAATANHFARESHIDELAHALGVDPLELRLTHLEDERLADVLRAAERAAWRWNDGGRGSGGSLGIACGVEKDARVATCAEVSVAGAELSVTRIVTAFDCGAIVDADNLVNQIEGATVMGLGGALFEQVHFARGRLRTLSLSEYRVPRFRDVPAIEVVLVDRPEVPSAGAGETPIVCVAPAIANAVFAATGLRIRSLPLLSEGTLPLQASCSSATGGTSLRA
jgi:CO/xanthine dehydrogenase Mo-binding subunit/aerobic-type carbon monoxide dehydrogenase small subunit (CoxS/CutS family)